MMKIEFKTDGAAFHDEYESEYFNRELKINEILRVLNRITEAIHNYEDHGPIMDINGNKIGEWSLD